MGVKAYRLTTEFVRIGLILFLNGNTIATEEVRMAA